MAKFNERIKKAAKVSSIILANDYDSRTPKVELKTIQNIKTLHASICALKLNFHLLLQLGKKEISRITKTAHDYGCLLYTSPSPRDGLLSRMPSSA